MPTQPEYPPSLVSTPRWLPYVLLPGEPGSKHRKIPLDPRTLMPGNLPQHCDSFDSVMDSIKHARPFPLFEPPGDGPPFAGVGFRFEWDLGAPFAFTDLDDCRDVQTGKIAGWAEEIIAHLHSFTEVSQSLNGIHIFTRTFAPPDGGNRKDRLEIYWRRRWAAVTGWHLPGTPFDLEDRTGELLLLHSEFFPAQEKAASNRVSVATAVSLSDDQLLARARRARNGQRFRELFDLPPTRENHSEEDLSLCCALAFWTRGDPDRIDRLFRRSALYRQKWERHDYRSRTITKAIATVGNALPDSSAVRRTGVSHG